MKKSIVMMMSMTLVAGIATNALAGKKNEPKKPEKILEEIGGTHFVEKMKVSDVGSVKMKDRKSGDETYFHVYSSYVNDKYRVIIFDNKPTYLGYYETDLEPTDYEEGAVLLDTGDGENFERIRLSAKGPNEKISIDGVPSKFVKNEKAEADKKAEAAVAAADEKIQPEYREWTIINRGKKVPVQAIFVKQAGNKVFLKEKTRGITKPFPVNSLSRPDQEYLKKIAQ
jgi:hypothetical protein